MNSFDIKVGAEPYTIGENINGQFFIKKRTQTETIASLTSPSFLIDPANGDVFIKGVQLKTTPPSGYTFTYNTGSNLIGNRPGDAIASGAAAGGWVDPNGNINDAVYNGAADNNNSIWNWLPVSIPTSFPSNQLVHNTLSVSGSTVSDGFRTSSALLTGTLPVTCTVSGAFLASPTRIPDSALIWASQPNYYDPSGGSNGARYTYNYTLTVGIVKRVWNGTSLIQTNVASQDISIPFRAGFYSRTADFSCSFNFSMEYQDTNGYNVEYAPYFNHNGWMGGVPNQTAELRRNGEFTVTFVTGLNK